MRARAAASVALTAVVAALLAGCGFWVPVATQDPYNPSDGVNGEIGELELRNVLVITEDGDVGSLLGTAVNNTSSDIDFTLQWKTDGDWYEVELVAESNSRTDFGFGDGEQVNLDNLGVEPGGLLDATVHVEETQKGAQIPVLDTSFVEYEDSLPTPTPTPTETPEPTETPAP